MKKPTIVTAILLAVTFLGGCTSATPTEKSASGPSALSESPMLREYNLSGMDAIDVINFLDRLALEDRPDGLKASVQADTLLLSDSDSEATLPLPEDKFYLSVAPYLSETHECFYHNLTGCKGELSNEKLQVSIVTSDGKTLFEGSRVTFDNGFMGFWLPSGVEGTITVTDGTRQVTSPFGTGEDDPTCLTTLQMV